MNIVYLVNAQKTSFFKIGVTNNIKRRINDMQTGCPLKIKYVHAVYTEHGLEVENQLHSYASEYHVIGEWYELPFETVKRIILLMNLVCKEAPDCCREVGRLIERLPSLRTVYSTENELQLWESIKASLSTQSKTFVITNVLGCGGKYFNKCSELVELLRNKYE